MTRYTKLDGRRGGLSKSTAEEHQDIVQDIQTEDGAHEPPSSAEKPTFESGEPHETPTQLWNRAKLLRLKAKKAKNDDKRKELENKMRELEKRAHFLNGQRGQSSPKKRSRDQTTKPPADANPWKAMEAGML